MEQLILIGAGGFARETAETVRTINAHRPTWDLLGFLDDDPALRGRRIDGVPVLGEIDELDRFADSRVVVCTGRPGNYFSRARIVSRLALPAPRFANLVHPAAVIPDSAHVGPGTVLLAGVIATTAVRIAAHVAAMPGVILTHDDVVGDFVTLGAGVHLGGRVQVGEGAYIGAGALVREDRSIGPWAMVGMGAVVIHDVPPGEVWAGVPARFLRHQVDAEGGQNAGLQSERSERS